MRAYQELIDAELHLEALACAVLPKSLVLYRKLSDIAGQMHSVAQLAKSNGFEEPIKNYPIIALGNVLPSEGEECLRILERLANGEQDAINKDCVLYWVETIKNFYTEDLQCRDLNHDAWRCTGCGLRTTTLYSNLPMTCPCCGSGTSAAAPIPHP